ncbi:DUF6460 domain-containing protein [Fulvimarina sp. 2208YS6-2-32]|uniref:DUF6460 domain-containing protein n=1 Tax=Fulvimarina uroteuthidis TaxID=3098149 RepID=A0ABU5HWU9_9HYPH|nr:DUF6460 domain-containing protein [Fulvimarina sp. 2208YS6-2-32]MDY8107610.1 DUF6460 domain-containing protein [Fulvimarina sp. 2208YS6-2-32]
MRDISDQDDTGRYGRGRVSYRLERFLGGSPLGVGVRLILMSIVVGLLLSWFDISPRRVIDWGISAFNRIVEVAFGSVENVVTYFLLGAVIVVPIFIVMRILKMGGR